MKHFFSIAIAAIIAALCGCTSDENPILDEQPVGGALTAFTASFEGTRALYDNVSKCAIWEAGDQIFINGSRYQALSGGSTTTFYHNPVNAQDLVPTAPYNAYFGCFSTANRHELNKDITETWADGKFNMPMYATSTTENLQFKNLCGVLKVTVKNDQLASVKSIMVSSANCATSGSFTVQNNAAVLMDPTKVSNTVTVTYTQAVATTAEGKVFYVAIPAQTYRELCIKISDGTIYRNMTTKKDVDITVERNKIYPIMYAHDPEKQITGTAKARINDQDVDVRWYQLWSNGPKFAEYNVGVTDGKPESAGGSYWWSPNVATEQWGSNWRMPTMIELTSLGSSCRVEGVRYLNGVAGVWFYGNDEFSANSIFLPLTTPEIHEEEDVNENGRIWSSTPNIEGFAYRFKFGWGTPGLAPTATSFQLAVRAVLNE